MRVLLAFFLLGSCLAFPTFDEYVRSYSKSYSQAEYAKRRLIYERRVRAIEAHNGSGLSSHVKDVNQMTDWTDEEQQALLGFDGALHRHRKALRLENEKVRVQQPLRPRVQSGGLPIPKEVDWAAANATTPVKNQGGCGSCWAFAGTEAIESDVFLETGVLIELAPQLYVDCVSNSDECGGSGGCQGAITDLLFDYATVNGARNASSYPYIATEQYCLAGRTDPVAKITGWVDVLDNDYTALMLAVAKQPVTIGVAASQWFQYKGGVFAFSECDAVVNHAVLLVGYGTDPEHGDYWKVQNSWGPDWGENGFIRLARSESDNENCQMDKKPKDGSGCKVGPSEVKVCGTCGLLYAASYPVGGHLV